MFREIGSRRQMGTRSCDSRRSFVESPRTYRERVDELFWAYEESRLEGVKNNSVAYYTTADTALAILRGRSMWLRNAAVMNDYMEFNYGRQVVERALKSHIGVAFLESLARLNHQAAESVKARFGGLARARAEDFYILSLCEHDKEDRQGRLSMWRAYGGPTAGACLVLDRRFIDNSSAGSQLFPYPVLYGTEDDFQNILAEITQGLNGETFVGLDHISNEHSLAEIAGGFLDYSAMSIKHPGFAEEREWRVFHIPAWSPEKPRLETELVSVRGTPQKVYKHPMTFPLRQGWTDRGLQDVVSEVIIGPSLYPETMRRAFVEALKQNGYESPEESVRVSGVPLRQWG